MNATQFLKTARRLGEIKTFFRFPYVYVVYCSSEFTDIDETVRELNFSKSLKMTVAELRSILRNSLLSLQLLTPEEFVREYPESRQKERGHHWLSALIDQEFERQTADEQIITGPRIIHFYGYKGGQSRSTLLGLISIALAEDGWKVLVVDSDIEAPSLDILYARTSRSISGTLLGVVQSVGEITPERVRTSIDGTGYVDLLACRPKTKSFDIDAAAFALRSALDPLIIEDAARRISEFAKAKDYDVVLIDHRSGLSPVTLPWMSTLSGPTVICVRLDEQWRPAEQFIKSILRTYSSNPGVFVSWKPDEENLDSYRQRNNSQIDTLLEILAETISEAAEASTGSIEIEGEEELSAIELEDHWLVWHYDNAFRQSRLPERKQLSQLNLDALSNLRSLLNINFKKQVHTARLSPSGAVDEGDLIQTDALRDLTAPGNSISYILGRKGTGKTRLLRELARAGIGEPLLVDSNSVEERGIKSPSPELVQAAELYKEKPDQLWWRLLSAALKTPKTSTKDLSAAFSREMEKNGNYDPISAILARVDKGPKRIFLLDGLETAFSAKMIFTYVESLFRFLQTVESDSRLSNRVHFKLFLRIDLAKRGYQNIEQQLAGRAIYLNWDTQRIFNFLLSRLARIEWYQKNFPELIQNIEERRSDILKGTLSTEDCENFLLAAFPEKVRRNNLATKTFLKTYFSDSASDRPEISASDKLRYYPRIFDKFLEVIANPSPTDVGSFRGPQLDKNGKISQDLIFVAHEAAAAEYLGQLRTELNYLINLSDIPSENEEKIRSLLDAFAGLKTPFKLDTRILELASKVMIEPGDIRAAMDRMKNVGIFEDRPDYPGELRVGRLFKSSLKMVYARKRKSSLAAMYEYKD